jgi:hypothetical protein
MAKNYEVRYTLVYEGGGKTNLATTVSMNSNSFSEAESKIREKNTLTSNVRQVQITEVIER